MKPKWLIEDFEGDSSLDPLIAEVQSQGFDVKIIDYLPFESGTYDQFSDEDCVIFYGSLNLANQLQREKPWIPGPICNFKNLSCLTYYSHWGHTELFNDDYIMLPLLEVSRKREDVYGQFGIDDCIFMRPDSGAKTFYGNIYPLGELDREIDTMRGYAGKDLDEILVIVSTPKFIENEWRIVVVAGEGPIAASRYKKKSVLSVQEGAPDEAMNIAYSLSKDPWQPDKIYVVDVCEGYDGFWFLEVNSFSCSGLYACDVAPVVKAASRIAIEEWEEYNTAH